MQEGICRLPFLTPMPTLTHEKTVSRKDIFGLLGNLPKPYFENKKHKVILYKENCFDVLPKIPENSIDMIFADPPYFLSNGGFTCHAGKKVAVNKRK